MPLSTYLQGLLLTRGQANPEDAVNNLAVLFDKAAAQAGALITGLQLSWVSGTSITVGTGACVYPAGGLGVVSSPITKTGIALGNNVLGYVYLYDNAGTPAVEVITTAPTNYFGSAWQKTSVSTRRYLGSVRTDSSGNIYRFLHFEGRMRYLVPTNAAPFRALSAGNATTRTSVSLAGAVPVTARLVRARLAETGGQTASIGEPDDSGTFIFQVDANGRIIEELPVDASQNITYSVATSAGALYVDVLGYVFNR